MQRRLTIKVAALGLVLWVMLGCQARADQLDDANIANDRGDYATAAALWLPLAEQGNKFAQYQIAVAFYKGTGVPQSYDDAFKWFKKAAEQGLSRAQNNLGTMYSRGHGVVRDLAGAMYWYRKAADQLEASGQFNIGRIYGEGSGVAQDFVEAAKWYRLAANQGMAEAQLQLGLLYARGTGVPQNDIEAYKWFDLSAASESDSAINRDKIAKQMSPEQVLEAKRLVHIWYPLKTSAF